MKTLSRDQARAHYDHLGAKQDSQGYYEDPAIDDLIKHAEFSEAQSVFEFGCGTGRFAETLLAQHLPPDAQYLGIDLSPKMVVLARTQLTRFKLQAEIRETDGSLLGSIASSSYDRFVSNYVMDLLSENEIETILSEAHRIVRVGGLLCLVSLSNGCTLRSRLIAKLLTTVNVLRPSLIGGCRPIHLLKFLSPTIWQVRYSNHVAPYGIPSEVVVAEKTSH